MLFVAPWQSATCQSPRPSHPHWSHHWCHQLV